jgi:hypothetical protein
MKIKEEMGDHLPHNPPFLPLQDLNLKNLKKIKIKKNHYKLNLIPITPQKPQAITDLPVQAIALVIIPIQILKEKEKDQIVPKLLIHLLV